MIEKWWLMLSSDDRLFLEPTRDVARSLLGCILFRDTDRGFVSGRIVETEAYVDNDPANHASRGMTKRNASMFGPPGYTYVYRIHQVFCLNFVTQPEGTGEAVLVRAVEPIDGIDVMQERRGVDELRLLASGPGRLCQAFDIDRSLDGVPVDGGAIGIRRSESNAVKAIARPRIGISRAVDMPLRFYIADNKYISKK